MQYNGMFSLPVTSLPCQVALILLDSSEAVPRQPETQSLNPVNNIIIFFQINICNAYYLRIFKIALH